MLQLPRCQTDGHSSVEADAMSERVVVTGVGAVTPLGLDFPNHMAAAGGGRRCGGTGHSI